MQTPFLSYITSIDTILLVIFLYLIQLGITELLITILNRIDPTYKRTSIHYFLPFISIIAYTMIIIEESYCNYIKPRLHRIYKYITKL